MGSFSIWHWLIVLIVVVLVFSQTKYSAQNLTQSSGANLVHSITAYIVAAMHDGAIPAQATIDRLGNRHQAKLPELGIDTEKSLEEAKKARSRNYIFGFLYLAVSVWLFAKLFQYPLIEKGELYEGEYFSGLLLPLFATAALSIVKSLLIDRYLRREISGFDKPISLNFYENVIVFGGFSPFAGFGDDLDSWSLLLILRAQSIITPNRQHRSLRKRL